jgi:hypothetical protein
MHVGYEGQRAMRPQAIRFRPKSPRADFLARAMQFCDSSSFPILGYTIPCARSDIPAPSARACSRAPFSHPDWLFEIKWDGFRSLVCIEQGKCRLMSRKGNEFKSFRTLNESLLTKLKVPSAVLDARSCA